MAWRAASFAPTLPHGTEYFSGLFASEPARDNGIADRDCTLLDIGATGVGWISSPTCAIRFEDLFHNALGD